MSSRRRPSTTWARTLAAAAAVLSGACVGPASPEPLETEQLLSALVTEVPGFHFYPPLDRAPESIREFKAGLLDRLAVSVEATDAAGVQRTVVTLTRTSQPRLREFADREAYVVNLVASTYFTDRSSAYALRVTYGGVELGRADLSPMIFNFMDRYPNFTMSVRVAIEPEAVDRDGDGVFDFEDHCPDLRDPTNPPAWLACPWPGGVDRRCDGVDEDQDGLVDEDWGAGPSLRRMRLEGCFDLDTGAVLTDLPGSPDCEAEGDFVIGQTWDSSITPQGVLVPSDVEVAYPDEAYEAVTLDDVPGLAFARQQGSAEPFSRVAVVRTRSGRVFKLAPRGESCTFIGGCLVDFEWAELGQESGATTCGLGACASTGERRCVGGAIVDTCLPGAPVSGDLEDRSIDGVDSDCDGAVDDYYCTAWAVQFGVPGTVSRTDAREVSVDPLGDAWVLGATSGALDGQAYGGGTADAYVARFDPTGARAWTVLLGGPTTEMPVDLVADATGAWVLFRSLSSDLATATNTLVRLDRDGRRVRSVADAAGHPLQVLSPRALRVAADALYVSGVTRSPLSARDPQVGQSDLAVLKLDLEGRTLWTRQLGVIRRGWGGLNLGHSDASSMAVTSDAVYVGGTTTGGLVGGVATSDDGSSAFVARFAAGSGDVVWIHEWPEDYHRPPHYDTQILDSSVWGLHADAAGVFFGGTIGARFAVGRLTGAPGTTPVIAWEAFEDPVPGSIEGSVAFDVAYDGTTLYAAGYGPRWEDVLAARYVDGVRQGPLETRGTVGFDRGFSVDVGASGLWTVGSTERLFDGRGGDLYGPAVGRLNAWLRHEPPPSCR